LSTAAQVGPSAFRSFRSAESDDSASSSPIDQAMQSLAVAVKRSEELHDAIEQRLTPVLTEAQAVAGVVGHPANVGESPLVTDIGRAIGRIATNNGRLEDLLQRLQV
jgi:hypothetical protein